MSRRDEFPDRAELMRASKAYDAFLLERFRGEGITCGSFDTYAEQLAHGDLWLHRRDNNFEIKFHPELQKWVECFFVETEELPRPSSTRYVPSGICAKHDAKWFGMGDYRYIEIMRRADLLDLLPGRRIMFSKDKRTRGFTLDILERRTRGLLVECYDFRNRERRPA